jgi:glutathione S-transferase
MAPPYNDLTYYTFGTPNGLKPAIVLEELGLKYKCEAVSIMNNVQKVSKAEHDIEIVVVNSK